MSGQRLAEWLLVAGVVLGTPVGLYLPPPALAQLNPVLRGQKYLLWGVYLTRDGDYAEAEKYYRWGLETWERSDVIPRLDAQQKQSIPIFEAFAQVNQRLLNARGTALQAEQKALERLWRTHQRQLAQIEAHLEKERGIPLFAGTAGVPKRKQAANPSPPETVSQRNTQAQRVLPQTNSANDVEQLLRQATQLTQEGKYAQAEPLYRRVLSTVNQAWAQASPNERQAGRKLVEGVTALANVNRGLLYASQGRHGEAQKVFQDSLRTLEQVLGRNDPNVVQMRQIVESYARQQNPSAPTSGQSAFRPTTTPASRQAPQPALGQSAELQEALRLNEQVVQLYEQGRYGEAIPLAQRSLAIWEKALEPNHPEVATSLHNLAGLYEDQGNYGQALPLVQRSLAIWEKALGPNHPEVATSLHNLAGLYRAQGNYGQALPLVQRSTEIEENHLARNLFIGTEEYKRNFLNTFRWSTDWVISFHLQALPQDVPAARLALTTILRRKGRILDVLSDTTNVLRQRLAPADQQQFDRLASLRTQLAALSLSPQPDTKTAQIKELTAQAEQLEADLSRRSGEFAQQTQPVTLAAVQQAIPANAALVEFIEYEPFNPKAPPGKRWGAPRYAVYVLQSTGEPRWADLGLAAEIDTLAAQYRTVTLDPRRAGELRPAARALAAKIMAPVRKLAANVEHFLIAPDGQLNLVSFAALVDEQDKFLIERYLLTYLTSGRELLRLQSPPPPSKLPVPPAGMYALWI